MCIKVGEGIFISCYLILELGQVPTMASPRCIKRAIRGWDDINESNDRVLLGKASFLSGMSPVKPSMVVGSVVLSASVLICLLTSYVRGTFLSFARS